MTLASTPPSMLFYDAKLIRGSHRELPEGAGEKHHPVAHAPDKAVDAAVRNQRKLSAQETVLVVRTTTHGSFRQMIPQENTLDPVRTAAGQERLS